MLRGRLRTQIYATIVASLVAVACLTGIMWAMFGRDHLNQEMFDVATKLAALSLPAADAPKLEQRKALRRFGRELNVEMTLFDRNKELITHYGDILPAPDEDEDDSGWQRGRRGPGWALLLPDGRWLVIDAGRRAERKPLLNLLLLCLK